MQEQNRDAEETGARNVGGISAETKYHHHPDHRNGSMDSETQADTLNSSSEKTLTSHTKTMPYNHRATADAAALQDDEEKHPGTAPRDDDDDEREELRYHPFAVNYYAPHNAPVSALPASERLSPTGVGCSISGSQNHPASLLGGKGFMDSTSSPQRSPHASRRGSMKSVRIVTLGEASAAATPEPEIQPPQGKIIPPTAEFIKKRNEEFPLDSDDDDEKSRTGSDMRSDTSNNQNLQEMLNATVPFYVQVLLLMLIPISFLVAFSSMSVNSADQSHRYILDHVAIARETINLGNLLMDERHHNSMLYAYHITSNNTGLSHTRQKLDTLRPMVDASAMRIKQLCTKSNDEHFQTDHLHHLDEAMLEWAQLRTKADHFLLTTMMDEERLAILAHVADAINVLTNNEKASLSTFSLRALFLGRQFSNFIGASRTAGLYILSLGRAATVDELVLYNRMTVRLREYQFMFEHIMEHQSDAMMAWLLSVHSINAKTYEQMADIASGNYSRYRNISTADYDAKINALFDMVNTQQADLLYEATQGKKEKAVIVRAALLLVAAIVCSSLAAAFLVYKEAKATKTMKKSLDYSKMLTKAVQRYVPRRLLKLMGSSSIMQVTVGDYAEVAVTMLFSDIRDFSSLSEVMTNADLFHWLQDYLSQSTRITESRGGFVDKFIGDAIFTVFNAPQNAIHCGIDMHIAADTINLGNIGKNKKHLLKIGVGIHHGVVCAGLLGDETRLNATLISSDVNHASRLEGLTKYFGARILVSAAVADQVDLSHFASRRIGRVRTKGHSKHVEVFEVFQADPLPLKDFKKETKERYEHAIHSAETRNDGAKQAHAELEALVQEMVRDARPEDIALRCFHEHMENDGVMSMLTK